MNDNKKEDYEETFYIIPRWIRKLPGMSLAKLDFIETMFQFFNKGLPVYLSNNTIKQRTGINSDDTINVCFVYFENAQILKRIFNENGHRVGVEFITNKIQLQPQLTQVIHKGVSVEREGGLGGARGGVSVERDHNIKKLNIKNINKEKRTYAFSDSIKKLTVKLRNEFKDTKISYGQVDKIVKAHDPKIDIEWSINNIMYDYNNGELDGLKSIMARFYHFIVNAPLEPGKGYYPDNKIYTKNDDNNDKKKKKEEEAKNIHNSSIHSPLFNRGSSSNKEPLRKNEQFDLKSLIAEAITRNKEISA